VANCSKHPFPNQWTARRALAVMQARCHQQGRRVPTGVHPCRSCPGDTWHITSKGRGQLGWRRRLAA